jgi:NTP pyrophosphatase (non-canonical NTP hydrolase)
MNTIKELQKEIHQIAIKKGFWEDDITLDINYRQANIEYDQSPISLSYTVSRKLMLIVSELGEALEALRNNKLCNKSINIQDYKDLNNESLPDIISVVDTFIKDTFEDELADSVIRILDLAEWLGIDLETHIKLKIEYNKTRDIKHNKEF